MNQGSSHPQTKIHWWILRGLVEVLHILFLLTGWVAPSVIFIVLLIFSIIGIVNGSESLLDGVAAFLGALILYGAADGGIFLALWALMALLEWVLPPDYRPRRAEKTPPDLPPHAEQARAEQSQAALPVPCPDPQCGGFLNRLIGTAVYLIHKQESRYIPASSTVAAPACCGLGWGSSCGSGPVS